MTFWAGLMQGVASGIQQGQQSQFQRQMMELQKKQLDAQLKSMDATAELNQGKLQELLQRPEKVRQLMQMFMGGMPGGQGQPQEIQGPPQPYEQTPQGPGPGEPTVHGGMPQTYVTEEAIPGRGQQKPKPQPMAWQRSKAASLHTPLIQGAAQQTGVDPALLAAQIEIESGGNPKAVNPESGAQGPMQLMPETAKQLGVTDPFDPRQNIPAGAEYTRQMMEIAGGDPRKAAFLYHAGPGNIENYGNYQKMPKSMAYADKVWQKAQDLGYGQQAQQPQQARGPVGAQVAQAGGPRATDIRMPAGRRAPQVRIDRGITMDENGGLKFNLQTHQSKYDVQFRDIQTPQGMQTFSIVTDDGGNVVGYEPLGRPAPPQKVQEWAAQAENYGFAPGTPEHQIMQRLFMVNDSLQGETKAEHLIKIEQMAGRLSDRASAPTGVAESVEAGQQRAQRQKADVAAAETTAKGQATLDLPMSTEDTAKFGVTEGTTKRQAYGRFALTPEQRGKAQAFMEARPIVDEIAQKAANMDIFQPGATSRIKRMLTTTWGVFTQENEAAAALDRSVAKLPGILKSMGQAGSLSDLDMIEGKKLLPSRDDTINIVVDKINEMQAFIDGKQQAFDNSIVYQPGQANPMGPGKRLVKPGADLEFTTPTQKVP